ncbi:MAG: DNA polymerase III subunit beta [Clostridia bacterium]|nr:DNA polymerase III subunit beta [Clostridia bacterium]
MKFTCTQQTLSKALNTVSKAVTNRTTIPILKGILLDATEDGKLSLTASDMEISIEKKIDVDVIKPGKAVVQAKLFSDIIRKLSSGEVLIELKENRQITIKNETSQFNIAGLPEDEFPGTGEMDEDSEKLVFEKDMFKDMIKKTSFAASIDESKGIIVGVLIEIEENSINMVALDGFRMAIAREMIKNSSQKKIIIAAKILNDINKIISEIEGEEELTLILNNKKALILVENTRIVLRLLEGEFIKYKDIVPGNHKCRIKVKRTALMESIERASILAKEGKNNLIKIMTGASSMTITSRSEEGDVKEEVSIERAGNDLEIGFNSKYIIDVLKVVDDEEIVMDLTTSVSPCLIRPSEGDAFEYLILPVRI